VVDFLLYVACGTVFSQHTEASLALVPSFHVGNILMKYLSVLVTVGAKILREEV
jgi:hypothetical protein